jgi:S1-C subfamily serine protease
MTTAELVRQVKPCIVRIEVSGTVVLTNPNSQEKAEEPDGGCGTGFFFHEDGYIATNSHVVRSSKGVWKSAPDIRAEDDRGIRHQARLLAHDPLSDLAVLKIDRDQLPDGRARFLKWADPAKIEVGEDVVAIGFARSQEGPPSVTKGIVGGLGRQVPALLDGRITYFSDLIQTDAAINPGNSGGPLLNMRGEVVGVNTLRPDTRVTQDAGTREVLEVDPTFGIGFARSCESAAPIVELLKDRTLRRPDLGAQLRTITRGMSRKLPLSQGLVLVDLGSESLLKKAGARPFDQIVWVQGRVGPTEPEVNSRPAVHIESWRMMCEGDFHTALALIARKTDVALHIMRPSKDVLGRLLRPRDATGLEPDWTFAPWYTWGEPDNPGCSWVTVRFTKP